MSVTVECPCGKKLKAKDEAAGKSARCPACGKTVTFPDLEPVSSTAPLPNIDLGDYDPFRVGNTKWEKPTESEPVSLSLDIDEDDIPDYMKKPATLTSYPSPPPLPKSTPISATAPLTPKPALITAATFSPNAGSEAEPWYYGFLEKYAQVGNFLGLAVFLLGMLMTFGVVFGTRNPSEDLIGAVIILIAGAMVFGLIYVGILFSVALILLAVNAGRNLRAIRQVLQNKG